MREGPAGSARPNRSRWLARGARVQGKHHRRAARLTSAARFQQRRAAWRRVVHVRRPVQGHHGVPAGCRPSQEVGAAGDGVHGLAGMARARLARSVSIITLPTKRTRCRANAFAWAGCRRRFRSVVERAVGQLVGQHAVDFFRHGAVEAAQARFHVDPRHALLGRHQRAGDGGVDVAHHQHGGRAARSSMAGSKRFITSAVCWAWPPEPTSRLMSGLAACPASSKYWWFMATS